MSWDGSRVEARVQGLRGLVRLVDVLPSLEVGMWA